MELVFEKKTNVLPLAKHSYETTNYGCVIELKSHDVKDQTVELDMDGPYWFDACDLREAAELFTNLADHLEGL